MASTALTPGLFARLDSRAMARFYRYTGGWISLRFDYRFISLRFDYRFFLVFISWLCLGLFLVLLSFLSDDTGTLDKLTIDIYEQMT